MIVEFETAPESEWCCVDGKFTMKWASKVAVDLTWVAGAQPHFEYGSSILLAGSNNWTVIRCTYPEFMTMWRAAREGKS
jgi:hypothetical protein